jgi:hypothetical protein
MHLLLQPAGEKGRRTQVEAAAERSVAIDLNRVLRFLLRSTMLPVN